MESRTAQFRKEKKMTRYFFSIQYKEKDEATGAPYRCQQRSVEANDRYDAMRKVIAMYERKARQIGFIKFKSTSNRLRHSM